jgi:ribonuclease D
VEECEILEKREWAPKPFNPDGFLRMKGIHGLSDTSKRILKRLYLYRDGEARRLDRPAFKVMPDPVLIAVARSQPANPADLDKLFRSKNPMKRRHGTQMLDAVEAGLADDYPIPKKKRATPQGPKPKLTGRAAERGFQALKKWRNDLVAGQARLSPVTVASNTTLKAIVNQYPTNLEELKAIPEVRRWQVKDYGEKMLDILRSAVPNPTQTKSKVTAKTSSKEDAE